MGKENRATSNRKIRQEALRDQLAAQGHVQHVVDIAKNLGDDSIEPKDVTRLKAKADIHLALIKKYIPDLKAIELSGDSDNPIQGNWTVTFVNPTPKDEMEILEHAGTSSKS